MLSLRELERAAAILRREIVGHRIQQVVQPDATTVVLELFGGDEGSGRRWLALSCDPERARVVRAARRAGQRRRTCRRASRSTCARTCAARACATSSCSTANASSRCARAAPRATCTLLLAIFGRKSNLAVLDAESRIALDAAPARGDAARARAGWALAAPGPHAAARGRGPLRGGCPTRTISRRSRRIMPSAAARAARTSCAGASRARCARRRSRSSASSRRWRARSRARRPRRGSSARASCSRARRDA